MRADDDADDFPMCDEAHVMFLIAYLPFCGTGCVKRKCPLLSSALGMILRLLLRKCWCYKKISEKNFCGKIYAFKFVAQGSIVENFPVNERTVRVGGMCKAS